MIYEKIIIEMLDRIKTLEDKVETLMKNQSTEQKDDVTHMTTENIRQYIKQLKADAKAEGKDSLIIVARSIHKALNLKHRFPMVCNAMRDCMNENDKIIFQPPKGNSSTLEIEYKL